MSEVEKVENEKKSNHGGRREGSGRKPMISKEKIAEVKELIAAHGAEFDEVRKKERILALLDVLYDLGLAGNALAIREYLDRQVGKAKQPLVGGEDGDAPLVVNIIRKDGSNNPA